MTMASNTVSRKFKWGGCKPQNSSAELHEVSAIAIDLTVKAIASEGLTSTVDERVTGSGLRVSFFNDCVYKDFFGVCVKRDGNFTSNEIKRITGEVLEFFNSRGFRMSVMITYYRAKTRFSPYCSLTVDLNFWRCYDNAPSRELFSSADLFLSPGPFAGVPAPQAYF